MAEVKKKMKLLSELEHVLKRPQMYVSSTIETDETVHYLEEEILHTRIKSINIGMYKLLWEIFDNAIDEIKRVKAKSRAKAKKNHVIEVVLYEQDNRISVRDNGEGFYQSVKKHPKSKVTNIETAFCFLRAGSNFDNEDIEETLIGTNGVGATLTNMLSEKFYVLSINNNSIFEQTWVDFKVTSKPRMKTGKFSTLGTKVEFIPRESIFGKSKFDASIIRSQLAFRKKCMMMSPNMENMEIVFYVDNGEEKKHISLPTDFFHLDSYIVELDDFLMAITPKYNYSGDFLMINSTQCTGSPTRYIQEILDEEVFKNTKAHNYYNIQLFMNLPPDLVKFGDQNKTKYSIPKNKISPIIQKVFKHRNIKFIFRFAQSETYLKIIEDMNKLGDDKEQKAILNDKKKIRKASKKYLPASKKREFLFIVEGDSAGGSISQGRNPSIHGIYQLKGKIQNCRKLSDLRTNQEIMELISILDLKFDTPATTYQNIVIAADADPDGHHIAALLYNFFYRWFPQIVIYNKLYILKMPLLACGIGKNIKYFYSFEEFNKNAETHNKRYFKGLGSFSPNDWEFIMNNMHLYQIKATKLSKYYIDMAFGDDSNKRKLWLNGIPPEEIYKI